jgi:23S rRNA (guanosine2251-2'-O)-methyltransferase
MTRSVKSHQKPKHGSHSKSTRLWIYGLHAVTAALANPNRVHHKTLLTANALKAIGTPKVPHEITTPQAIAQTLPPGAVHQGAALQTDPLPIPLLEDICTGASSDLALVADQVTDPQNIGAILRSCAAFGAKALILHARNSPPLSGALAKAASGALEHVPVILVTNLARALDELGEMSFTRLGLAEEGDSLLSAHSPATGPTALVLGAEGSGMRRLTREKCDALVRLPTSPAQPSLNVSNAAAVALYELVREK